MLSVLIACLNEEENIRTYPQKLLPALEDLGQDYEVVLVDDGSTDQTWREIVRLAQDFPRVRAARHARNEGLGAALRTGFASCRGEFIATLDADLTFSPSAIANLISCQRETGADMVSGSPFLCPAPKGSWKRRLPSLILNRIYAWLLDRTLTSYTPILRLYRAQALKGLGLKSSGFEINAEISAAFLRAGRKAAETPAALAARFYGRSKLAAGRELKRHARLMLRLLIRKP